MRFISKFVAPLLVLVSLLASQLAYAFKPASEKWGHTMITQGVLGSVTGERSGYSFGLGMIVAPFTFNWVNGTTETKVSDFAAKWIVNGVVSRDLLGAEKLLDFRAVDAFWLECVLSFKCTPLTDDHVYITTLTQHNPGSVWAVPGSDGKFHIFAVSSDLMDGNGHFDNDNIMGSTVAIKEHTQRAIVLASVEAMAATPDITGIAAARMMLGKAIHTLQDFYAHSNWAETHPSGDELFLPMTDYLVRGDAGVFDSFKYYGAKPVATEGATSDPTATSPYAEPADTCFATDQPNATSWFPNDGNWDLTGDYAKTEGRTFITTGAFWTADSTFGGDGIGAGSDKSGNVRCDHGSSLTVAGVNTAHVKGIAKDAPWMPLAYFGPEDQSGLPSHVGVEDDTGMESLYSTAEKVTVAQWSTALHRRASYFAALHTRLFLEKFVTIVKTQYSADKANKVLQTLFGGEVTTRGPFKIFVVDHSGTMHDTLPAVVNQINASMGDNEYYGLVDFTDSVDVSDLLIASKTGIASRLGQLTAKGGGGCQAPIFKALNRAMGGASIKEISDLDITYFTDASSSDAPEFEQINTGLLQKTKAKIRAVVSGSCSPLDPAYVRMSQATNSPLLIIEPSAEGVAAAMTAVAAANNNGRLVYVEDGTTSSARIIDIPVETGATALTFRVTQTSGTVTILQPNGQALVGGAGVVFSSSALLNGQIVTVPNPTTGIWKISLAPGVGGATYFAQAQLSNTIDFLGLEFFSTMQMGRPGHVYQPMLPPQGQAGLVSTKATIPGGASNVQLQLLDFGGNVLGSYPLSKSTDSMFEGDITLPGVAYRARVLGRDSSGQVFSRMLPTTQTAPLARVAGRLTVTPTTSFWAPGNRYTFYLLVTNLGGDDTVAISSPGLGGASVTFDRTSFLIAGSSQAVVTGSILFPQYITGNLVVNVLSQSGATFSVDLPIDLRPMLTVNASAGAGGRIWPDYAQATPRGDRRTFTLLPEAGATILAVTGCGGTLVGSVFTTGAITENCQVSARFSVTVDPQVSTLSVIKYGSGSGTVTSNPAGIDCGLACSANFGAGQTVTLTASPAVGATFTGWTGACTGAGSSCTVMMDYGKTVIASFGGGGGSDTSIPLLNIGAACGLQQWPQIVNLSGGEGPAFTVDMVAILSTALDMNLRFVEQTSCGTVNLAGFNGGNLAFVPLAYRSGDTRANGVYPMEDGQYQVVRSAKSLVIAPAVLHIEQLAVLFPGVVASQGDNGVIVATYNGVAYVVQPGVAVQLDDPNGGGRLAVGSDGLLHFLDAAGNNQVIYPAFAQPATVRSILQGLDPAATLSISLNGTASIVFNGQRYTLLPDLTLGAIPADRAGQPWWQESTTRYRLVNAQPVGTTQGFTVMP